jgi:hypothetical protein
MTKWYITFSGAQYHNTTARIVNDAPRMGADKVLVYDDQWLQSHRQEFVQQNKWAWEHPQTRGYGWFIWKPFILLDVLDRMAPGDIVLFTDADTYPIHDFSMLYDKCQNDGQGIMLFSAVGCAHKNWCKRDQLIVMAQDSDRYRLTQHGVARFMLFQKGPWRPRQFLMEWLTYCVNPLANTFDPSVIAPEYPDLHQPRCEQAIMTNLAHKYGYHLHREACQFGNSVDNEKDLYPQLFFQDGSHSYGQKRFGSDFANVPA